MIQQKVSEFIRQLAEHRILIEENEDDLSIVDATVIGNVARPRTKETVMAEDSKEENTLLKAIKWTV